MGKGNRQRQLARQRAMRQAARRQESRRRRRRQTLITAGVLVTVVVVLGGLALGGIFSGSSSKPAAAHPSANPSASASASASSCTYTAKADQKTGDKKPGLPPAKPAYQGLVQVKFTTSTGGILVNLDATKAPCTVNALGYLVTKKFYDATTCHRVTTTAGLTVLQCGDPTGTGAGGPGFTYKDENLTGATYKRGTVAMANSGPNTNGSQLFFVDKDSSLPASYTPVGTIVGGLENLDKVIKAGTSSSTGDGAPKVPVKIITATLAAQ